MGARATALPLSSCSPWASYMTSELGLCDHKLGWQYLHQKEVAGISGLMLLKALRPGSQPVWRNVSYCPRAVNKMMQMVVHAEEDSIPYMCLNCKLYMLFHVCPFQPFTRARK